MPGLKGVADVHVETDPDRVTVHTEGKYFLDVKLPYLVRPVSQVLVSKHWFSFAAKFCPTCRFRVANLSFKC